MHTTLPHPHELCDVWGVLPSEDHQFESYNSEPYEKATSRRTSLNKSPQAARSGAFEISLPPSWARSARLRSRQPHDSRTHPPGLPNLRYDCMRTNAKCPCPFPATPPHPPAHSATSLLPNACFIADTFHVSPLQNARGAVSERHGQADGS